MSLYSIPILLGTTRANNQSAQVAKFLQNQFLKYKQIDTPLLDLATSDFPLLTERVSIENEISPMLTKWTSIIQQSNGVIIVSPEYKSGYPGSLKNFLDYLPPGILRYKPIGISTVSSGIYAGTSCLQQLRHVVIGMAGIVIPRSFSGWKCAGSFQRSK